MSPSRDVVVNVIGVDKGTSAMLKKIQSDADTAGTGLGNSIDKGSTKAGLALQKFGNSAAGYIGPAGLAIAAVGEKLTQTATKGSKLQGVISEVGKVSLLAGVAGIAAFGAQAVKAGSALDDAQASLKASVKASGQVFSDFQAPVAAVSDKMEKLGFTNADVAAALAKSDISTQNLGKSISFTGVAADLAVVKHISLADAMDTVDRAATGNLRALTSLGISLPITATSALKLKTANDAVATAQQNVNAILAKVPDAANAASAAHGIYETAVEKLTTAQGKLSDQQQASGQIIDALTQKLGGQAAAAADTLTFKTKILNAEWTDFSARLGQDAIPKLESLMSWVAQNKTLVEDLALAFSGVLGLAMADFAVTKVAHVVTGIGKVVSGLESLILKMTATKVGMAADFTQIGTDAQLSAATTDTSLTSIATTGEAASLKVGLLSKSLSALKLLGPIGIAVTVYEVLDKLKGQQNNIPLANLPFGLGAKLTAEEQAGATGTALPKGSGVDPFDTSGKPGSPSSTAANSTSATNANTYSTAANSAAKAVNAAATAGAAKASSEAAKALAVHTAAVAAATAAHAKLEAAISKVTTATQKLISDALTKAQTALAAAQTAFTSFAASTSSSITSQFSFGTADSSAATDGTSFISALQAQAGQVGDFSTKVNELLKDGLSQGALQQVLSAGTSAGTDIANQLLAGGAGAISQANQLTQSVTDMANGLGTSAATEFYSSGVTQAQSMVNGIVDLSKSKKVASALTAASAKIAESLKASITIDLNIIAKGGKVPKLASGGIVTSPTYALIGEAGPEAVIPLGSRSTGAGAAGGTVVNNYYISTQTMDPQAVLNALRIAMQRNGSLGSQGIK
jgi:hypothetical protein